MSDVESSHVLLVDNSLTNAELTIYALKVRGRHPRVTWLTSAEETLRYMSRDSQYFEIQGMPQLLLLDVDLPGIGGIGVLQWLKGDARTKHVPIVMLSSCQNRPIIQKCYESGANSYVVKPAAVGDYLQRIEEIANYWLRVSEQIEVESTLASGLSSANHSIG